MVLPESTSKERSYSVSQEVVEVQDGANLLDLHHVPGDANHLGLRRHVTTKRIAKDQGGLRTSGDVSPTSPGHDPDPDPCYSSTPSSSPPALATQSCPMTGPVDDGHVLVPESEPNASPHHPGRRQASFPVLRDLPARPYLP